MPNTKTQQEITVYIEVSRRYREFLYSQKIKDVRIASYKELKQLQMLDELISSLDDKYGDNCWGPAEAALEAAELTKKTNDPYIELPI